MKCLSSTGHSHIDILKVDIEGWEFGLFETLIRSYKHAGKPLPFGQLQLEIHAWAPMQFETYLKFWEMLEEAGLRPFWTEVRLFSWEDDSVPDMMPTQPNLVYLNYNRVTSDLAEYSFLNIKGDNIFIRDPPSLSEGSPV